MPRVRRHCKSKKYNASFGKKKWVMEGVREYFKKNMLILLRRQGIEII